MIPRLLHFIWVGRPMPARWASYVDGWRALHPDWTVRVWGDGDLVALDNQGLFDAAEDIAGPGAGQLQADIARYEILRDHGGVYLDVDYEPRRALDPLCDVPAWAAWEVDGHWVANGAIAAVPGHPVFQELVDAIPASIERHRHRRPNAMTGPRLFTPAALRHDFVLHPSAWFHPYRYNELHRDGEAFPDAFAVHHWANQRRLKGVPL